jgi:hypothetical protein
LRGMFLGGGRGGLEGWQRSGRMVANLIGVVLGCYDIS